jgi:oxygen-dependent protoporphyrinogen oxidase
VPAGAAAEILRSTLPTVSDVLERVRYFPTTVALVEYDRSVFSTAVRALAMDDGPCSNAGAYGREDRHIVRYTFSGRAARTVDPSKALIEAWLGDGEATLNRHVPESRGARRLHVVTRHWRHGYCGYLPFHTEALATVRLGVGRLRGLSLAGDYLLGASIEACCRSGEQAASALVSELQPRAIA